MGWLQNWSDSRKLSAARADMLKARSPWSINEFVSVAIDLNKAEEGLQEIQAAIKEFPNSECLQTAYRSLIKRQSEEEIRRNREELKSGANGLVYYKLAQLYKQCGDYDQAIEFSRKGTRLYPDFEGNYIILGGIRYERFQRDLRSTDGLRAIELLEKASDLNRENYRLLKQLAEIYLAIGAKDLAIVKLNEILSFAPDDSEALKLLGQAHKLKTTRKGGIKEILTEFERRAELHDKLKNQGIGPRGQRFLRNASLLYEKIKTLEERVPGFQRVVVLSPQSRLLAAHPNDNENERYVTALKDCFEAGLDCSLRMDISTFEKGLFETENGLVYLLVFDRLQMGLFCSNQMRSDRLIQEIHKFLEHDLYI
ncbi:MAG: tetratricopeptide repeat protein [Planctomycetota bacterium]|nr:tetratricopeptide repeat protein [Planctomycetota bacterium]